MVHHVALAQLTTHSYAVKMTAVLASPLLQAGALHVVAGGHGVEHLKGAREDGVVEGRELGNLGRRNDGELI